jgi:TPR repeat protein
MNAGFALDNRNKYINKSNENSFTLSTIVMSSLLTVDKNGELTNPAFKEIIDMDKDDTEGRKSIIDILDVKPALEKVTLPFYKRGCDEYTKLIMDAFEKIWNETTEKDTDTDLINQEKATKRDQAFIYLLKAYQQNVIPESNILQAQSLLLLYLKKMQPTGTLNMLIDSEACNNDQLITDYLFAVLIIKSTQVQSEIEDQHYLGKELQDNQYDDVTSEHFEKGQERIRNLFNLIQQIYSYLKSNNEKTDGVLLDHVVLQYFHDDAQSAKNICQILIDSIEDTPSNLEALFLKKNIPASASRFTSDFVDYLIEMANTYQRPKTAYCLGIHFTGSIEDKGPDLDVNYDDSDDESYDDSYDSIDDHVEEKNNSQQTTIKQSNERNGYKYFAISAAQGYEPAIHCLRKIVEFQINRIVFFSREAMVSFFDEQLYQIYKNACKNHVSELLKLIHELKTHVDANQAKQLAYQLVDVLIDAENFTSNNMGDDFLSFFYEVLITSHVLDDICLNELIARKKLSEFQYARSNNFQSMTSINLEDEMFIDIIKSAEQKGRVIPAYQLGLWYSSGNYVVEKNIEKAIYYFQKAIDEGCANSRKQLDLLLKNLEQENKPNELELVDYLLSSTKKEDAIAQLELGSSLLTDNPKAAKQLLTNASDSGNAKAHYLLTIYFPG